MCVDVLRAQLAVDRLVLEVVVTVGQAQAALRQDDHVVVRILLIRGHAEAQRRAQAEVGAAHERRHVRVAPGGGDGVEPGLRGCEAEALDGRGVEVAAVVVADLLRDAAGRGAGRQCLDDGAHLLVRALAELLERAPARVVGRDLLAVEPVPFRVAIEVIAGLDGRVARAEVEAPRRDLRRRCGGRHRGCMRGCLGAGRARERRDDREGCGESFQHEHYSFICCRQMPAANSSQAAIQASPPKGVRKPSASGAPRASAYRLPLNSNDAGHHERGRAAQQRRRLRAQAQPDHQEAEGLQEVVARRGVPHVQPLGRQARGERVRSECPAQRGQRQQHGPDGERRAAIHRAGRRTALSGPGAVGRR